MPIKNGILTSERRVATETAKYNAVMTGTVNLRTEGLDLIVTPIVRGEVTTVVRLSGTLAAPVVDVNAVGAIAKRAVKLYATVATFGAWWVTDTLIKTNRPRSESVRNRARAIIEMPTRENSNELDHNCTADICLCF